MILFNNLEPCDSVVEPRFVEDSKNKFDPVDDMLFIVLWCSVMQCNSSALWYCIVSYNFVWYGMMLCIVVWCGVV